MNAVSEQLEKTVRKIDQTKNIENVKSSRPLRTAAYCRVSTDSDEQEMSFDAQVEAYTDMIMKNPNWSLVDIFADEGISGTQVKNRDEFMRMIRMCRQGKIDQIITKSVSRFGRNTVESLMYVRELKSIGVSVIFEKERMDTSLLTNEIFLGIHCIFAQSESESLGENVRWGKQQSAKNGNVYVNYSTSLAFKKGPDGNPEINPSGAETINYIGDCFLEGDSMRTIKSKLETRGILSPKGNKEWSLSTIKSILTDVKNKGDALLCKTYVVDTISHKRVKNTDRPQYYVSNCLPKIMSAEKFDRIQLELARRSSISSKKGKDTTTELGRYSSKYALTEILVCGKCGTSYRRAIWTKKNKKKVVWRCINRLDYGLKYCPDSATVEESLIHDAIVKAITEIINEDYGELAFESLKDHIQKYYGTLEQNSVIDYEIKLQKLIKKVMSMTAEIGADSEEFIKLSQEIADTKKIISQKRDKEMVSSANEIRMDEIINTVEKLKNTSIQYDDKITRKLIDCIKVMSKNELLIIFKGGIQKTIIIGE